MLLFALLGCRQPPVGDPPADTGATALAWLPDTGSPDGPVPTVERVEIYSDAQIGAVIAFRVAVTDPQGDLPGGRLYLLTDDGSDRDTFDYPIVDAASDAPDSLTWLDGHLGFLVGEVDLAATYAWRLQIQDAAGNVGPPAIGEVSASDPGDSGSGDSGT